LRPNCSPRSLGFRSPTETPYRSARVAGDAVSAFCHCHQWRSASLRLIELQPVIVHTATRAITIPGVLVSTSSPPLRTSTARNVLSVPGRRSNGLHRDSPPPHTLVWCLCKTPIDCGGGRPGSRRGVQSAPVRCKRNLNGPALTPPGRPHVPLQPRKVAAFLPRSARASNPNVVQKCFGLVRAREGTTRPVVAAQLPLEQNLPRLVKRGNARALEVRAWLHLAQVRSGK
jgi:hypothetical protein